MEITEEKGASVSTFKLRGHLDSSTSRDLERRLFDAMSKGIWNIVIDLEDLDYISSAGLRVILKATHALKGKNGRILLCSMQDYVKEVFEVAGLDSFLAIFPTHEDAMQSFT